MASAILRRPLLALPSAEMAHQLGKIMPQNQLATRHSQSQSPITARAARRACARPDMTEIAVAERGQAARTAPPPSGSDTPLNPLISQIFTEGAWSSLNAADLAVAAAPRRGVRAPLASRRPLCVDAAPPRRGRWRVDDRHGSGRCRSGHRRDGRRLADVADRVRPLR